MRSPPWSLCCSSSWRPQSRRSFRAPRRRRHLAARRGGLIRLQRQWKQSQRTPPAMA
ncbi:unnamed protein product [Symbiodinium sp. CCMP2592]|nr:unnamed protein product [Symbiodinium sp. CCMP2592]